MPTTPPPVLVARPEEVEALAASLSELAAELAAKHTILRLAVDTEFHAERRFQPALMLVQLALADGRSFVLDPLQTTLRPLATVLPRVELLVHGGVQDLFLLHRATGTWPATVFDTQRAAALVGARYPARLADLLRTMLGQTAPPGRAMSDWAARPLDADQLRYATADATCLFALVEPIEQALAVRGRAAWARAASRELLDEAAASPWDTRAWRSWTIATGLDDDARRVIQALMDWRLAEGMRRDQPPHYLLGDAMVLQLARTRPGDDPTCSRTDAWPPGCASATVPA